MASIRHLGTSITLTLAAIVLSGCTTAVHVGTIEPGVRITKLTAVGYGASSSLERQTEGQKKLLAMRASKLDAYRSMAEQVYGVRIIGNSTVGSMMVSNDNVRSQVDAYIRGAKVVNITQIADGNYETTIEMDFDDSVIKTYINKAPDGYQVEDSKRSVGPGSSAGTRYYRSGGSFYYAE